MYLISGLPDVLECLRERCAERLRQEDCDDPADQARESHDEERDGHGLDADDEGRQYPANPGGIFDWVNLLFLIILETQIYERYFTV